MAQKKGGPQISPSSIATIKSITLRISSTAPQQLPHVAANAAASLAHCKDILSSSPDALKSNNDLSLLVHRFKTQLSTLLQDRTVEGRWAAVVLVKAAVEAGGLETLSKSNAWVRNLLAILKKPDPSSTRALALSALTRIFMLTWDHSNLIREITTPALPAFISSSLNNAASSRCSTFELQTILDAFATLIPHHPTLFRTNESQLRSLLVRILSSNSQSPRNYTQAHQTAARRLFTLLHHCAPKQTGPEKWSSTLIATVHAAHATADRLFRCIVEDWQSAAGIQPSLPADLLLRGEVELETDEHLSFPAWRGLPDGVNRLIRLLQILQASIEVATNAPVSIKLGLISDLTARLLALRVPRPGLADIPKPNSQIPKDERENLFVELPALHEATFSLICAIVARFSIVMTSSLQPFLSQAVWVFQSESNYAEVRTSVYRLLKDILRIQGPSMPKQDVADVEPVAKECCHDLLPLEEDTAVGPASGTERHKFTPRLSTSSDLIASANGLLTVLLAKVNPAAFSSRIRTLLERTAVLSKHQEAMTAAVLNPAVSGTKTQASLLPLLAHQFSTSPEVEAILRPRMPYISVGRRSNEEDDEEEADLDEMVTNDFHNGSGVGSGLWADEPATTTDVDIDGVEERSSQDPFAQSNDKTGKRLASDENPFVSSKPAKLQRVSPPAGPSSEPPGGLANAILAEKSAGAPITTVTSTGQTLTTATSSRKADPAPLATEQIADNGSDDSDFEIPSLTMDPDTDPEDNVE